MKRIGSKESGDEDEDQARVEEVYTTSLIGFFHPSSKRSGPKIFV